MHVLYKPESPASEEIQFADFLKVDIRIGSIVKVEDFPEARKPAYIVSVDFGSGVGIKRTSAQITTLYSKESLLGKQVAGVVNFPKKQIGKIQSEFLLLGFSNEQDEVVLFQMDFPTPNGSRLH